MEDGWPGYDVQPGHQLPDAVHHFYPSADGSAAWRNYSDHGRCQGV